MTDAIQNEYALFPNEGNPGEIADFQTATDGLEDGSRSASEVVYFGEGVMSTAADPRTVRAPTSAAEAARCTGVVVRDNNSVGSGTGGYPVGWLVRLLRRGRIRVRCETACKDGQQAYLRFATGVADTTQLAGAWRNDAGTESSAKAAAVPGAIFRTTTASTGKVVWLELNLEGQALTAE